MKSKSLLHKMYKAKTAYLFLLPLFFMLAVFCYYPAFSGLYHSFFNWNTVGKSIFIGIDNYKELFSDEVFLNSIFTMLKIAIPRLIIGIVVPFVVAELIFAVKSTAVKKVYRILILFPMCVPGVINTLIWKTIYDPNGGLLTSVLRAIGVMNSGTVIDWLGDPKFIIFSVIFMGFPWIGGTSVLIFTSGLMNISTEVIESSVLDGASKFRRIITVDIPLMTGQLRYFLITGLIGALQDYSIQVVLTKGGPGFSTMVPGYYMYTQAFYNGRMGYASALGMTLFVAIFILTLISNKVVKNKD